MCVHSLPNIYKDLELEAGGETVLLLLLEVDGLREYGVS